MTRRMKQLVAIAWVVGLPATALSEESTETETGTARSDEAQGAESTGTETETGMSHEAQGVESTEIGEQPENAESASRGEATSMERAEFHFGHGMQLVEQRHWAAALAEFDASLAAYPNPSASYNRALCLRNLHRYAEAIAALEQFLELASEDLDEGRRSRIEGLLTGMRELLTPVTIRVNVEGATVEVDDEEVGMSPLVEPVQLVSGPHHIEVRRPGFLTQRRDVVVVAGQQMLELFELEDRPPQGQLRVDSNVPGALVYIDGDHVGQTPYHGVLAAREHDVVVCAEGYREASRTISVEADDEVFTSLSLERLRRAHQAWFWSLIGLTAASTLATIGVGAAALALDADYASNASDAMERWNQGQDITLAADVVFGVTCALATSALVLGFFTDWRSAEERAQIQAALPVSTPRRAPLQEEELAPVESF